MDMRSDALFWTVAGSLLISGCSSKPRNFAPVLGATPTDAQMYQAQWLTCREEVQASSRHGSGRLASAAGGAVAGAGTFAVASAATAGTYATMRGAMAALGATIIGAPIAAIGGAWGLSKIKKTKKERAIKAATADCLAKAGYSVERWRVMSKREVRSLPPAPMPIAAIAAAPPAEGN
jgi:hypothetical protein